MKTLIIEPVSSTSLGYLSTLGIPTVVNSGKLLYFLPPNYFRGTKNYRRILKYIKSFVLTMDKRAKLRFSKVSSIANTWGNVAPPVGLKNLITYYDT